MLCDFIEHVQNLSAGLPPDAWDGGASRFSLTRAQNGRFERVSVTGSRSNLEDSHTKDALKPPPHNGISLNGDRDRRKGCLSWLKWLFRRTLRPQREK
jgi:hypothetical protein